MPKSEPVESVVPATEWDKTPMEYSEVPPTDEHGDPIPPALAEADGNLSALLKDDLVAVAEAKGLPTEGTKAQLIAAVEAHDNEEN
jgi:hypothetical protein